MARIEYGRKSKSDMSCAHLHFETMMMLRCVKMEDIASLRITWIKYQLQSMFRSGIESSSTLLYRIQRAVELLLASRTLQAVDHCCPT
jgi:hypothetical protein